MRNLFMMVMEADGDEMQPFDPGPDEPMDQAPAEPSPEGNQDLGPPPMSENDDMMPSEDSMMDDTMGDETQGEEDEKEDTSLSEKASNIMNQKLYHQMVTRNSEIDSLIKQLDQLNSVIPTDVVKANSPFITDLKTALIKGQKYVIDNFVDTAYGENILFFNKLDSLYTLLIESINKNLKKVNHDENE